MEPWRLRNRSCVYSMGAYSQKSTVYKARKRHKTHRHRRSHRQFTPSASLFGYDLSLSSQARPLRSSAVAAVCCCSLPHVCTLASIQTSGWPASFTVLITVAVFSWPDVDSYLGAAPPALREGTRCDLRVARSCSLDSSSFVYFARPTREEQTSDVAILVLRP